MIRAREIPKAHTPPGGYGTEMPPPVLEGCTEPLIHGAPDLRGTWKVVSGESNGQPLATDHPILNHIERIEQAGDRVVVTSSGIIHDMFADGTFESGVNDVMVADLTTPLVVAATFEDHVLVLRPKDLPDVEVRRWRVGDHMMWEYSTMFTTKLERIDIAPDSNN